MRPTSIWTWSTSLTGRIRQRAVGEELSRALNPAQQVIKIVLSELTTSLGGERLAITYASKPPTVILLAGLQGSGKTTNAAKLAQWFLRQGRSPLLVGADLQRPAAVEQLRTLGERAGVPVFSHSRSPVKAASASLAEAARTGRDVVIVDTAGRLAIDTEMMDQARRISKAVRPHYTFLVVDAHGRPGRGELGQGLPRHAGPRRRDPHEAGRRRSGRCRTVGEGRCGAAHRLRLGRREAGRLRAVPSRPSRQPHPGDGRRRDADRQGRGRLRRPSRRKRRRRGCWRARSLSTTSCPRCSRSSVWATYAASSA